MAAVFLEYQNCSKSGRLKPRFRSFLVFCPCQFFFPFFLPVVPFTCIFAHFYAKALTESEIKLLFLPDKDGRTLH